LLDTWRHNKNEKTAYKDESMCEVIIFDNGNKERFTRNLSLTEARRHRGLQKTSK
jgi:hypothetical protein